MDTETDECLLWPFGTRQGYGIVKWKGRCLYAYRVLWELAGRERPVKPLEMRHLCGKAACVNLRHLAIGTRAEQEADKVRHGTRLRGEALHNSRLTEAEVRQIKRASGTQKEIAAEFGTCASVVSRIRSGIAWKHVA